MVVSIYTSTNGASIHSSLILVFTPTTPLKPPKVTTDIHITISIGPFWILILVNFSTLLKHHQQSHYILISLPLSQSLCHLLLLHSTSKVWFPWSSIKDSLPFSSLCFRPLMAFNAISIRTMLIYIWNPDLSPRMYIPLPAWLLHLAISTTCINKLLIFPWKPVPFSVFLISINDLAPHHQNFGRHPWFLPLSSSLKPPHQALSILNISQICLSPSPLPPP